MCVIVRLGEAEGATDTAFLAPGSVRSAALAVAAGYTDFDAAVARPDHVGAGRGHDDGAED